MTIPDAYEQTKAETVFLGDQMKYLFFYRAFCKYLWGEMRTGSKITLFRKKKLDLKKY